jgi:hypothetical protein
MAAALQRQVDSSTAIAPGDRIDAYRLDAMLDRWATLLAAVARPRRRG